MMEIVQADIAVASRYRLLAVSEIMLAAILRISVSTFAQKHRNYAAHSDDKSEYAYYHVHIIFLFGYWRNVVFRRSIDPVLERVVSVSLARDLWIQRLLICTEC